MAHSTQRRLLQWAGGALLLGAIALWAIGLKSPFFSTVHHFLYPAVTLTALVAGALAWRRRAVLLALPCLCNAVLGVGIWVHGWASSATPAGRQNTRKLEVVSYNVLFRSGSPTRTLATIRAHPADIYLFQEVTPAWKERLGAALGSTHPHMASYPHAGTHGFAIFSRFQLGLVSYLKDDRGNAVAQCATVSASASRVVVCNLHLASPAALVERPGDLMARFDENAALRRRQWDELLRLVRRTHGEHALVMIAGDFNTLDSEPLYRHMRREFVDVFRERGSGFGATFPNGVRMIPRPIIRLDYLLVSPEIKPVAARVLPGGGSDHLGLAATVSIPDGVVVGQPPVGR